MRVGEERMRTSTYMHYYMYLDYATWYLPRHQLPKRVKGIQENSGRTLEAVQDILSTLCPLSLSIATVNVIVDTMVGYCLLMRKKMMMSGGAEQAYYSC